MTIGHFIWTDLSTYDLEVGRTDYSTFFGWAFQEYNSYSFAQLDGQEIAALFPMPSRLAEMNMPSFWMSYVHVENIEATVDKARKHDGVIIEVEPQAFNNNARIALVRDPSGAGFTLYEGTDITPTIQSPGTIESRFHHVSDLGLIKEFYSDLFGWNFTKVADQPWPVFDILHADGSTVAQIEEVAQDIRGKFNYWMPCFKVNSVRELKRLIDANEGKSLSELPGNRAMVVDRQGAHFMVRETKMATANDNPTVSSASPPTTSGIAWKALLGLICIWLAVFFDIQAFWGVLFLMWTWTAIKSGRADFIEPVDRYVRKRSVWPSLANSKSICLELRFG